MRLHVIVLGALTLLSGCVLPGETGPSTGGSDAGTTRVCDERNDCNSCASCALNGPCADVWSACQQNAGCVGIDQCFGLCGPDTTCKQQCYLANPDGATAYDAVLECVYCDQCPSDCPGVETCS